MCQYGTLVLVTRSQQQTIVFQNQILLWITRLHTISRADNRVWDQETLFDYSNSDVHVLEPDTLSAHSISDDLNSRQSCVGTKHFC